MESYEEGKRKYKFYVVNVQTISIDSGWEFREDALERAVAMVKDEGHSPGAVKVMTKPRVGDVVLDPKNDASWMPKRTNPARRNPASVVRTARDERLWKEAKKAAAHMGRDDYAYVMGIYKRMHDRVGGGVVENPAFKVGDRVEWEISDSGLTRQGKVVRIDAAVQDKIHGGSWREVVVVDDKGRKSVHHERALSLVGARSNPNTYVDLPDEGRRVRARPGTREHEGIVVLASEGEITLDTPDDGEVVIEGHGNGVDWDYTNQFRTNPKRPEHELTEAEADLSPEEFTRVEEKIASPYTIRDFPNASANCFRLGLIFMQMLQERDPSGMERVFFVPTEYVDRRLGQGSVAISYRKMAQHADEIFASGDMRPFQKKLRCVLEANNSWSADVKDLKGRKNVRFNPGELLVVNPEADSARAEEVYEMWHKKQPHSINVKRAGCDEEDVMVCVGRAHNIVYRSGKWEHGRKTNDYVHHFDSKPKVYMLAKKVGENGASGKTVGQLLNSARNADGKFAVADLATPLSFGLDDKTDEGSDIEIYNGARVYGAIDQRTVIILDPKWGLIVVKGGEMHFDERGIVK